MNDPRKGPLRPYVRQLADLMALRDWSVRIADEGPDNVEALASVHIPYGQRRATIRLSDQFLDDDPESQRDTLVHELMHLHFDSACKQAEMGMKPKVFEAWMLAFEHAVDASSRALAQAMPTMAEAATDDPD